MSVITFKPNDHTKITTDFERYEFACPCGCTAQMIDPELVQKMQTIRTKLGKAIKVTSGYRCVKHNADPKVGGSRTSRHLYGIAADWRTKDRSVNPVALGIIAAAQGFGAVGIYWHDKAAIVHTDTRGGKATAKAVQRIPDAHCNGDMHAALDYASKVKHAQREVVSRCGIKSIVE